MVDVADSPDVDMGLLPLELAAGGADGEAAEGAERGGGGGRLEEEGRGGGSEGRG